MENPLVRYISRYTSLTEEEKRAVEEEIPIVTFKKGTILLREGEIAERCYFNLRGLVRQYYLVDGEERTTFFYTEEYGISGIPMKPSKYYLICEEDTTLTLGDFSAEADFFKRFPKFESLCRVLSSEYFESYEELLATYIMKSPEERYAILIKERPGLVERVPQYQLASYLGITPESLSRIRRRILLKS
ncbi:Crp/Fnr family transcriptional regulator [Spongiimicrobium salis]|uniref:Crp/Fnr family transcriptional regulator n=1 Tax=Spongiimicrobium salis TaxID=1667022 RepID=UPI00374C9EE5